MKIHQRTSSRQHFGRRPIATKDGHVGEGCGAFERTHDGFGYGTHNMESNEILKTCVGVDLAIVNTFLKNTPALPISYKSGRHATQTDFYSLEDTISALWPTPRSYPVRVSLHNTASLPTTCRVVVYNC